MFPKLFLFFILLISCQKEDRTLQIISSEKAPQAIGPYSQAILSGNTLYSSGQIAIDPVTGDLMNETIEIEVQQIMRNHLEILDKAGMDFSNVVNVTIYLTDLSLYKKVNAEYSKYFNETKPARATVEVSSLPKGARIELSMISIK